MNNLFIVWSASNNLGIPIIDEQHRGIVSTINSLYYLRRMKKGEEILPPMVTMMWGYTRIHFATEEGILRASSYPDLDAHAELHAKLASRTKEAGMSSLRRKDSMEFLQFLKEWWLNHINRQDRLFAEHVKNYYGLA